MIGHQCPWEGGIEWRLEFQERLGLYYKAKEVKVWIRLSVCEWVVESEAVASERALYFLCDVDSIIC